ncbi:haloacid dehalogenase-like hydrolase [Scopulibacillus cellulosilyticus]|uniref:Haloacid dehalogenase-like hydrolase n=1 Tax=Scopulibacillus cellulosilyticus TaxID=2665665 RepID=A0ABW2PZM7_9BACL
MKRLISCHASDLKTMNGRQLKQAIAASEGRVIVSEVIPTVAPLYREITNIELAAAFGADLILLNLFDVLKPHIIGWENIEPENLIRETKKLTGRPIGVNLEPVDPKANAIEKLTQLPKGRLASKETFKAVKALGFDFICLTGNPKTGVTNTEILEAIQTAKIVLGDDCLIIAGKMHGAGINGESGDNILSRETIKAFAEAGADVILIPSPGTLPGVTNDIALDWINAVKHEDCLAMSVIGTSQEGADEATLRQIALNNKMIGADIHHIGDAGYTGIAVPENIMAYSIAIRGRRHTHVRMASSILR